MERNGSTDMFVNVLIVTDLQHGSEIFRGGSLRRGEGHRGLLFLFFLPACLPYLFLCFPGRADLLAGLQTESERVILFRTVGAFFCKHCLKFYRPLWGKEEGGGGGEGATIAAQSDCFSDKKM